MSLVLIVLAHQLQFDIRVKTFPTPIEIEVSWINTYLFRDSQNSEQTTLRNGAVKDQSADYTLLFHGKDRQGHIRVNITITHQALRVNRKSVRN